MKLNYEFKNKQLLELALTQSGINSKEYALFTFQLPPVDEQIAIADTLSAFDRHLANLSELIAKYEGIRSGALEDLLRFWYLPKL